MDALLKIGVFARRSRLSLKALRLYDRLGLLTPRHVDAQTGYRWYEESQLETARLVGTLRRLDIPLSTIAEIISAPSPHAAEMITRYWQTIERDMSVRRELVSHLLGTMRGDTPDTTAVAVRDVLPQQVLTEQRHTTVDTLSCWLGGAFGRLHKAAADLGGPAGHPFAVYYGDVSEDSDGPVEVCVPISLDVTPVAKFAVRHEPAHREAYLRLRRAQVEFPQILSAYDLVTHWISQRELNMTGAPREVYFADFASAEPDDQVCDVAIPVG
ncbi:MerR family transcriptional regulator [Amycolatopsis sp. lyj-108]|uniref:MerR family transcriptional regulator n=1 Tax=Amycolatopsis sp. lyj-108 TaxID=2789286 RepID=UPI00397E4A7E